MVGIFKFSILIFKFINYLRCVHYTYMFTKVNLNK